MNEIKIEDMLPLSASRTLDKQKHYNELGGAYISFVRESVEIAPEIGRVMYEIDWSNREHKTERHWGAYCTCSECNEDFYAGYMSDITGCKGIILAEGEDGLTYPGWIGVYDDSATFFQEGFDVVCPMCGAQAHLISATRKPRKYATRVTEFEDVGGLGSLITYELRRELDPRYPSCVIAAEPVAALVKNEKGKLECFAFRSGAWKRCKTFLDPHQQIYHDYDSSCYRKIGGYYEKPKKGETFGTTMEKTGLEEYLQSGGIHAHIYLRIQAKYPLLENLMKSRLGCILQRMIDYAVETNIDYGYYPTKDVDLPGIGVRATKPHAMLGLSKEEFRLLNVRSIDELKLYLNMKTNRMLSTAKEYNRYTDEYTIDELETLAGIAISLSGRVSLERISNYIRRERDAYGGRDIVKAYSDYIRMLPPDSLTDEVLLPRGLREHHDGLAEQLEFMESESKRTKFRELKARYSGLEWSNGRLCAVLPADPQELIDEGSTLRHCVGGYVDEHSGGKKIIVFIRHYRRPERSYYTLNIDLSDLKAPREIQLHGYGNERHGKNKEYRHSIPREVRNFCNEYERNIVKKWCIQQLKAQQMSRKGA